MKRAADAAEAGLLELLELLVCSQLMNTGLRVKRFSEEHVRARRERSREGT